MMKYFQACSVLIVLACISLGCSDSDAPALYDVAGEVVVDGEPLADGAITLEPADGKGGVYGERIQAGTFALKASAGEKRVSITAARPSDDIGPDGKPMSEQYIPARYNAKTELTARVEVDGENRFMFELSTK